VAVGIGCELDHPYFVTFESCKDKLELPDIHYQYESATFYSPFR
jgi:hypothetical protein